MPEPDSLKEAALRRIAVQQDRIAKQKALVAMGRSSRSHFNSELGKC